MSVPGGRAAGRSKPELALRFARPGDRPGLMRLGHPPPVARILAPSAGQRFLWAAAGTRSMALVAEESGSLVGSVHFVRSMRDAATWMFGHWRVAPSLRRRGIGSQLMREGVRRIGSVERLYSYVEDGNEASLAAHRRLGFEAAPTFEGTIGLGALSTLGPPAPALRLEPVDRRDWGTLLPLYAAANGALWLRLFPRSVVVLRLLAEIGGRDAVRPLPRVLLLPMASVLRVEVPGRPPAGFVVRSGSQMTLYCDPAGCSTSILARTALQLLALGVPREETIGLVGLPADLASRARSIQARRLMALPDARHLRS